jgi:hypothetical protein
MTARFAFSDTCPHCGVGRDEPPAGLAHYPLGLMILILVGWGLESIAIILAMQWRTLISR